MMNRKSIRKFIGLALAGLGIFGMTACGGGERADSALVGNYLAVTGEALGVTVSGDEVSGFTIDLKEKGKGTMTVDGDSGSCTWKNDDTTVTIKVEGEEMIGTLGEDTISFDDMLGMGMALTFAKEGTDAAKSENYLPEKDKNMLGVWVSSSVTDILQHDASEEVDPEGLKVEFFSDHTAKASLGDTDLGTGTWSFIGDSGYFDGDFVLQMWSGEGDEIELNYSDDDNYWIFTCKKQ